MLTYFMRTKGINVVIALAITTESVLRMIAAVLGSYTLNSLIGFHTQRFIYFTLLEIAAWLGFMAFLFIGRYLQGKALQRMDLLLRRDVMTVLSKQTYAGFHEKNVNTYASWLTNDITMIEERGFQKVYSVISFITDPIVSLVVLFQYHWSIVALTVVASLVTTFLPQIMHHKMEAASVATTKQNESFLSKIGDVLAGFDTLFAFHKTRNMVSSLMTSGKKLAKARIHQNTVDAASEVIGAAVNVTSQILTGLLTGYLALQRITSIGAIMTTGSLSANVYNGLANLGPELNTIRGVLPLFSKYHLDSLNARNDQSKAAKPMASDLTAKQLSYAYDGKLALAPINFNVPYPSKVAIVGDSGAGKSTLLNILSGKLRAYRGSVQIGTKELNQLPLAVLQSQVLYSDQLPYVFNETVRYNLTLGDNFTDQEIWHALAESDLDAYVRLLPDKLDNLAGENGRLFSSGQRQRLALARGLLRDRKILLIDEGTSSLNRASAIAVEDQFLSLKGVSVLFVTHQLHSENKDRFDQIIQLHSPAEQH